MPLEIRAATEQDLPLLTQMNRRLIEDEGSANPMSVEALQQRMLEWLRQSWNVVLFVDDGQVLGYAIYQARRDNYFPEKPLVYIRHFYIERAHRNSGVGTRAFAALAQRSFPPGCTVVLDVLASNPGGYRFWERLGFRPYCTTVKLDMPSEA